MSDITINLTGTGTLPDGTVVTLTAPVAVHTVPPSPPPPPPPPPPPGRVIAVPAGGDLQAALNQATDGTTITLAAGATYTGPFTLPRRGQERSDARGGVVTIQSASWSFLPAAGWRVSVSHAAFMPRIVSPGSGQPAFRTAPGAAGYTLIGLEVCPADPSALVYDLIALGDGSSAQNDLSVVPENLTIDRCFIHGGTNTVRGIALNSGQTTIMGSYISDFKMPDTDTQALCGWNGPGPYTITNNYLEAAAENILFGGGDPAIPNLIPSDILIRGNWITKPLAWRGSAWTIKNLIELKNARRVRIEGNKIENCWQANQDGWAVMLSAINQNQTAPWCTVEAVTITDNLIQHASSGINCGPGSANVVPPHTITITNNLFLDLNPTAWGGDGFWLRLSTTAGAVVEHNTALQSGTMLQADGPPQPGFIFRNNIARHGPYGVIGADGTAIGTPTLQAHWPGYLFAGNLLIGKPDYPYPPGNFFAGSDAVVGFVNPTSNYRLASSSLYRGAGTDTRDPGGDIDALQAALGFSL